MQSDKPKEWYSYANPAIWALLCFASVNLIYQISERAVLYSSIALIILTTAQTITLQAFVHQNSTRLVRSCILLAAFFLGYQFTYDQLFVLYLHRFGLLYYLVIGSIIFTMSLVIGLLSNKISRGRS